MLLAMLSLWLPGAASVSDGSDGSTVCVTGFIMDTFCIERGTPACRQRKLKLLAVRMRCHSSPASLEASPLEAGPA